MNEAARRKHRQDSKETLGKVIVSNVLSLFMIILLCFVLAFFVYGYGVRPVRVDGASMYPTLDDERDRFVLTNAFAGKFLDIERGDIVVAYEEALHRNIIKRVIGLPGDTVHAENETVYVNGEVLFEPYLDNEFANDVLSSNTTFTRDFGPVTLGEDEYWLLGDNRWISKDSIDFGPVERDDIKARGAFVLIPFSRMRVVK